MSEEAEMDVSRFNDRKNSANSPGEHLHPGFCSCFIFEWEALLHQSVLHDNKEFQLLMYLAIYTDAECKLRKHFCRPEAAQQGEHFDAKWDQNYHGISPCQMLGCHRSQQMLATWAWNLSPQEIAVTTVYLAAQFAKVWPVDQSVDWLEILGNPNVKSLASISLQIIELIAEHKGPDKATFVKIRRDLENLKNEKHAATTAAAATAGPEPSDLESERKNAMHDYRE